MCARLADLVSIEADRLGAMTRAGPVRRDPRGGRADPRARSRWERPCAPRSGSGRRGGLGRVVEGEQEQAAPAELVFEVSPNGYDWVTRTSTIEDGVVKGGFGSAIMEFAQEHHYLHSIRSLGLPDKFIDHGKVEELQEIVEIDVDNIRSCLKELLKNPD